MDIYVKYSQNRKITEDVFELYEDMKYERILNRMLGAVKQEFPDMDIREGSVIYTALAPAAAELAQLYISLDGILEETFADTASRDFLIKKCAERGITPKDAVCAEVIATITPSNLILEGNTRFSCGQYNYYVTGGTQTPGQYRLKCETAGSAPNSNTGTLTPISYIEGLESAEITAISSFGEDEEGTEALRKRYFKDLDCQYFGGNVADYKERVAAIDGVGGVKVYPAWNGGGTIKVVITNSQNGVPSSSLVSGVKEMLDPSEQSGKGAGLAPIGHSVTVAGAEEASISVKASITYQTGFCFSDISQSVNDAINEYFSELRADWENQTALVVRISQIETRLLNLSGIIDVDNTKINNQSSNLVLGENKLPRLSSFSEN